MMKRFFISSLFALISLVVMAKVTDNANSITRVVNYRKVTITFYSPSIVRVTKSLTGTKATHKSYSIIMQPGQVDGLETGEEDGNVTMISKDIRVDLNTKSGVITFSDVDGHRLLTDLKTLIIPRTDEANKGKFKLTQTFLRENNEAIYGLGQLRDTCMNQSGRHIEIWNHNSYTTIPYFTSEKGYGLYWDNAGKSYFDDNAEGTTFTSEVGTEADYYFIYKDGTQDGVIAGIRSLTGQATMFPLWTMGFWQSRERYRTSDELAEVLDKYRKLGIPTDAMVQDWQYWGCDSNWNAMRFMNPYYINKVNDPSWRKYLPADMLYMKPQGEPRLKSPQDMVNYVHHNNAHLMISIWPNFGPWTEQYNELKKIGALYPFDTWPRHAGVMIYDVFNPKARDIYWKYLTHLYNMGFDAWWTDSTEPDHFEKKGDDNWQTHDGSWLSVKNAFSLVHNKGIYDHQRRMKGNNKRSVQMTRSGTFGLQHYGTFAWSGDITASWSEMKDQIPSGLNYSLCGLPYWNNDLGGYFYGDFEQNPKNPAIKELQTRWMQWGTFMPIMRNHCCSPMLSEIYEMGDTTDWAYNAIVDAIKLRYRLLPYTYSTMSDCVQHSGTMMRALVMDFSADKKASRLNDEYMFGRSILVKPVTDPMYTWRDTEKKGHEIYPDTKKAAAPVRVYLPKGSRWYDFWDNTLFEGGQDIMRPYPIDIMPVFIKAGTIMPFGPEVQYSTQKSWKELEIRVYPGANGTFTLYEDEGDNYNYEKGKFSEITFSWDDTNNTLTIGPRRGTFAGMIPNRTFNLVLVNKNSGKGSQPMIVNKIVKYNGEKQSVRL